MQQKRKRDRGGEFRPVLRCPRRGCQTSRSIRTGNRFFHYTDLNGKTNSSLTICEILELIYFFTMDIPSKTTIDLTGKSPNTVTDWYNMCREVCGENRREQEPWCTYRRTLGLWINNGSDCRYFYVLRRDRATLLPIIQRECQDGSVIHSDEWPAYGCLNDIGYRHETVNH